MEFKSSAKKSVFVILMVAVGIVFGACQSNQTSKEQGVAADAETKQGEYFSVKVDGKLWQAFPSKEFKSYNLSYKDLGHQFSIFAEAEDGSRMDLSFHAKEDLKVGHYPSTRNDDGMLSGVFYYPEAQSSDRETASTTMDHPVQQNTVQVTKIDKSNKAAYIIEGTFSPTMYAVYETNPTQVSKLTEGKFRVIYKIDAMHPAF